MYFLCAGLAQLVEQRIRNAWVVCSSHITGTIVFKGVEFFLAPFIFDFLIIKLSLLSDNLSLK